jgi:hypothetical protein
MELAEETRTLQGSGAIQQRVPQALSRALTRTSWLPRNDIGLSDWVDHGRRLGVIGRCVGWWIGDWLRYGNVKFGERYAWASRITGYDAQTLMNMVWVASAYDVSERRPNLSFSHHAELAALPAGERDRWLDLAETNRLSVRCLREELRRARRLEAAAEKGEAGDTTEAGPDGDDGSAARCPHCGGELDEPDVIPLPRRAARKRARASGSRAG